MKFSNQEAALIRALGKLGGLPRIIFLNEFTIGMWIVLLCAIASGVYCVFAAMDVYNYRIYLLFSTGVFFSFLISGGYFLFSFIFPPDRNMTSHYKVALGGFLTIGMIASFYYFFHDSILLYLKEEGGKFIY